MNIENIYISCVRVDIVNMSRAINAIKYFILSNLKVQVCVTNVYSFVLMHSDFDFKNVNNNSALVVPDGMPLVWVSKYFGKSIPERVSGPDLFNELCNVASENGYSFYFLGSTEKTIERIIFNLKMKFPKLLIAGGFSPPYKDIFCEEDNKIMINNINAVTPDILWVGMTAPKQEKWIHANIDKLNVKVAIGIGAVFDFIADNKKRAPRLMQNCGLEWLFRLMIEPKRLWRRYLIGNFIFLIIIFKSLICVKKNS